MSAFPPPQYVPCPHCGEALPVDSSTAPVGHDCDVTRRLEHVVRLMQAETAAFDEQWSAWLASPAGRSAARLAELSR